MFERFDVAPLVTPHEWRIDKMIEVLAPIFWAKGSSSHPNLQPEWMRAFLKGLSESWKAHYSIMSTLDRFGGQCGIWIYALKTWAIIMIADSDDIHSALSSISYRKAVNRDLTESLDNVELILRTELIIRASGRSVAQAVRQSVARSAHDITQAYWWSDTEETMIEKLVDDYMQLCNTVPGYGEIDLGDRPRDKKALFELLLGSQRSKIGNDYFSAFSLSNISWDNPIVVDTLLIVIGIIDYILTEIPWQELLKSFDTINERSPQIRARLAVLKKLIHSRIEMQENTPEVVWELQVQTREDISTPPDDVEVTTHIDDAIPESGEEVTKLRQRIRELEEQVMNLTAALIEARKPEITQDASVVDAQGPIWQTPTMNRKITARATQREEEVWIRITRVFETNGTGIYEKFRTVVSHGWWFWNKWWLFCSQYGLPYPASASNESPWAYYKRLLSLPDAKKETIVAYFAKTAWITL